MAKYQPVRGMMLGDGRLYDVLDLDVGEHEHFNADKSIHFLWCNSVCAINLVLFG